MDESVLIELSLTDDGRIVMNNESLEEYKGYVEVPEEGLDRILPILEWLKSRKVYVGGNRCSWGHCLEAQGFDGSMRAFWRAWCYGYIMVWPAIVPLPEELDDIIGGASVEDVRLTSQMEVGE